MGWAALALVLLAISRPAEAQDALRTVQPGEVATLPVVVAIPSGAEPGDSIHIRVSFAEEIQPFGATELAGVVPGGPTLIIPLTLRLPRSFSAGPLRAASVEVRWPDGSRAQADLEILIGAVRDLSLSLGESSHTITPGAAIDIPFTLVNKGNTADQVTLELGNAPGWKVDGPPQPFALPANNTATGVIRVTAPVSEAAGRMKRLAVVASGLETSQTAHTSVFLVQDDSWGSSREQLPTSVFVGAFTSPDTIASLDQVIGSINAFGVIGEDTQVGLRASRYPERIPPASFRALLPPPRAQLMVGRPTWRATVGDVSFRSEPLGTLIRNGQGASLDLDRGRLNGGVVLARPWAGVEHGEGHVLLTDLGLDHVLGGRAAVVITDAAQSFFGGGVLGRSSAVGTRFTRGRLGDRLFEAEAGWMRVDNGRGLSEAGPTAMVRGHVMRPERAVDFRARYVPSSLQGVSAGASEVFVSGRQRITGPLRFLGRAWYFHQPFIGRDARPTTLDGTMGLGLQPSRFADIQAAYRVQRSRGTGALGLEGKEHHLDVRATVTRGAWSMRGGARRGTETITGTSVDANRLSGGLRYAGAYATLGVSGWRNTGGFLPSRAQIQIDGQATLRRLSVAAGLILSRTGGLGYADPLGWASIGVRIAPDLELVLGVEQNTTTVSQSEARLSLGIRKDFRLPLPIRRAPVAEGAVYDDLNNNGRRDEGEPGVADVRLTLGPRDVRTDQDGRFEIHGEAFRGYQLQVDVTSLADNVVLPPAKRLPSGVGVSIPLITTVSGMVALFLDSNGNGTRDAEEGAAAGARVTLTDALGRVSLQVADERGRLRLTGLPFGRYEAKAVVPQGPRNRQEETLFTLDIEPGTRLFREIGISDGELKVQQLPDGADSHPGLLPTFDFGTRGGREPGVKEDGGADSSGGSGSGTGPAPGEKPRQGEPRDSGGAPGRDGSHTRQGGDPAPDPFR